MPDLPARRDSTDEYWRARYLRSLQPHDLRRRNLRYSLLTLLHRAGAPRTITELLAELERLGLRVGGRDPRKVVSDALRYEQRIGRASRVRRGTYVGLYRPDTTVRRHRDRMRDLIAVARGELRDSA
ncbi:MAG: hypothetical protein ACYC2O_08035 [Microthrixaceae bacterium]